MSTDGKLMTGICQSQPELMDNQKIRLHESWQLTSGDGTKGQSVLEEIWWIGEKSSIKPIYESIYQWAKICNTFYWKHQWNSHFGARIKIVYNWLVKASLNQFYDVFNDKIGIN